MNAQALLQHHGEALIGRHVMTAKIGDYPGGIARVIRTREEPDDDIAYFVQHPTFREMGVFDWEPAQLMDRGFFHDGGAARADLDPMARSNDSPSRSSCARPVVEISESEVAS